MKKIYKYFFDLMIVAVICLTLVSFIISNGFASKGRKISEIDERISILKNENMLLYNQLTVAKSTQIIEEKSFSAGFVEPSSFLTVLADTPVAFR
ncbi:hypothetical protein ACFL1A_01035 [Patescibacteria group bacterium]